MPNMTPVSAQEMASIQSDAVAAVCDKTCQIWRDLTAGTPDAYGSSSSSPTNTGNYTLQHTTVAGMRAPTAGELTNYAFLIADKLAWTVMLPTGIDVLRRDHLVIDGQTLEVHAILTPQSYSIFTNCVCAQLK
jgi:hypothetical protein